VRHGIENVPPRGLAPTTLHRYPDLLPIDEISTAWGPLVSLGTWLRGRDPTRSRSTKPASLPPVFQWAVRDSSPRPLARMQPRNRPARATPCDLLPNHYQQVHAERPAREAVSGPSSTTAFARVARGRRFPAQLRGPQLRAVTQPSGQSVRTQTEVLAPPFKCAVQACVARLRRRCSASGPSNAAG
jgi:hypothetical protein